MRWKSKKYIMQDKYVNSEKRVVKRFLWFPKRFDESEVRWLEFAYILQSVDWEYSMIYDNKKNFFWRDRSFVDKDLMETVNK